MKIGRRYGGDKRVDTHRIRDGHRILMSCGGGMGGSKWYEYATEIEMDGGFIYAECLDGQSKTLSKNFIVSITPVDFYGQTVENTISSYVRKRPENKRTEWWDIRKIDNVQYVYDEGDNGRCPAPRLPILSTESASEKEEMELVIDE